MALLLGALSFLAATGAAVADGEQPPQDGTSQIRECNFCVQIPPFLVVGDCVQNSSGSVTLEVKTNTRTSVAIENTDFVRLERDCAGNVLETKDVIPGQLLEVAFKDFNECDPNDPDAPIEVVAEASSEGSAKQFCISSHRGGYVLEFKLQPGTTDPCDDAGCYEAKIRITIVLNPFDEPCACD